MINLAIQLLPIGIAKPEAYKAVDKAIAIIQNSGLKYEVCPFETVIEGEYDDVMQLVKQIHNAAFENGLEHILINMKLQSSKDGNVKIEDKIGKYR